MLEATAADKNKNNNSKYLLNTFRVPGNILNILWKMLVG